MNVGTIVTIAAYVIFFAIFLAYFFNGFKRGVKRSVTHFGIALVMIVAAYLLTPTITKAILNINVTSSGTEKTLAQYLVDLISSSGDIATALENSTALQALVDALPAMVLNMVVFIVLYIIVRLLGFIIYKIVERLAFKSKKKEKELGLKRNRLVGAGIGLVEGLFFFILAIAPLNSLVGTVGDLQAAYGYSATTESKASEVEPESDESSSLPTLAELLDYIPAPVGDAIISYNKSPMGVVGGMFGVDNLIYDELSKSSIDGETVKLRKDIVAFAEIYNDVYTITDIINNNTSKEIKSLDWDRIDKTMNGILEGGLVKGFVTNMLADIVINYEALGADFGEYENIVISLKTVLENDENNITPKEYFFHDIENIYSVVSTIGRSGLLDAILDKDTSTIEKVGTILSNEYKENITKIISAVLDLNILHDTTAETLKLAVNAVKADDTEHFVNTKTKVDNWETLANNINTAIGNVINANESIKTNKNITSNTKSNISDLISDPLKIVDLTSASVDAVFSYLGKALDQLDNLGILESDGGSFISELLDKFGYGQLTDKTEVLPIEKQDASTKYKTTTFETYEKFFKHLATPVKEVCELKLYKDLSDSTKNKIVVVDAKLSEKTQNVSGKLVYPNTLKNSILALYQLDILREHLFPVLIEAAEGTNVISLDSLDNKDNKFEVSYANWENDCEMLTKVLVQLNRLKVKNGSSLDEELFKGESDITKLITNLEDGCDISELLSALLEAKSTNSLKNTLFDVIENAVKSVTDETVEITFTDATFNKDNADKQTTEIVDIIKAFLDTLIDGEVPSVEDMDKAKLGDALNKIRDNAYRKAKFGKTNDGIFKDAFDAFYDYFTKDETMKKIVEAQGDVKTIDFKTLLQDISDLNDLLTDVAANPIIKDLSEAIADETLDSSKIYDIINDITTDNAEDLKEVVDLINELDYELDLDTDTSTAKSYIDGNTNISEDLKASLYELLGITA